MSTMPLGILGLAGAILFAIIVRQGTDEFKAWTPHLTSRLLELAIGKLPGEQRARMREEWAAHVEETPGEIGKWVEAAGFLLSARRTAKADRVIKAERPPQGEHIFPRAFLDGGYNIDMVCYLDANTDRLLSIQAKTLPKSIFISHYSDVHFQRDRPTDT